MYRIHALRVAVGACSSTLLRNESVPSMVWHRQIRNITSKKYRVKKDKPAPFPYETKSYNLFRLTYDHVDMRMDENSKVIIVDGPLSVGKHKIAKQLAEEFDMKFYPDPTMDLLYINDYGYDMRNLDPKMPESCQSYDEARFCREPEHFLSASFQALKYKFRYANYVDMLAHLMNTGQGVVTVRSPWSDAAFAEAMLKCKWISKPAMFTYNEIVRHTILFLLRPHLVIYVGASVDATLRNIKEKNVPYMVNSKALSREFLAHWENSYKQYLRTASIHSKVLSYDWSEGGDVDVIVEDIERIDFDKHTYHKDPKLIDWRLEELEIDELRRMYSSQKSELMQYFGTPLVYDAPEMWTSGNDMEVWEQLWDAAPGMEYEKGYDPTRGDKNIWFKTRTYKKWEPWS